MSDLPSSTETMSDQFLDDSLETSNAGCPPFNVRSFGISDRGKVRTSNEDHFLIARMVKSLQVDSTNLPQPSVQHGDTQGFLFIVADGMGGHAAGEEASAIAIDSVESFVLNSFKWFTPCKSQGEDQVLRDFQKAVQQVNARVLMEAEQHPEFRGMGTTLTLAYNIGHELFLAHVGDSRCYLSRDGKLSQLTRDHTLVEQLVRAGALAPEDVSRHRLRHVVTNSVGGNTPGVQVDINKLHLKAEDRLLVCSDGLTEMVTEDEIGTILQTENDPQKACRQLVNRANEAGGKDNVTVVVVNFNQAKK